VGVVGLELSRADFYEKELTFQVSCSYGPGRYDPLYEEGGRDYPVGFVRWTEQRNFEAVLDMMAAGRLHVMPLISHRFDLTRAGEAYRILETEANSLGILLGYRDVTDRSEQSLRTSFVGLGGNVLRLSKPNDSVVMGFIGAGNYASQMLIPAFKGTKAILKLVASARGVSAVHAGKKHGFEKATTDSQAVLNDPDVNAVVVATRHDSHAHYVCEALRARKHVFVEKPLAITREQLAQIESTFYEVNESRPFTATTPDQAGVLVMVGFNRRFAAHVEKIKSLVAAVREPKSFVITINAGSIPAEHWTQNPEV